MNLINSKFTQMGYNEVGFELSDWDKATIIWNDFEMRCQERIEALTQLANQTEDTVLKEQIQERLEYEKQTIEAFKKNDECKYVYVVKDVEDGGDWGFYSLYEGALKQAVKVALKYNENMEIRKQLIVTEEEATKIECRINPNLAPDNYITLMDYIGSPVADVRVNKNGEIIYIWSNELTFKEPLEECSSDRFENRFIKVPYVHCKGCIVKNAINGEYGILETSKEGWDKLITRVEKGLYVDYTDVAHTVYCLTEDGYWSHEHWSPMDMEVDVPEYDYSNKKERAMIRAFEAFSDYLSGYTGEATEKLVLSTTRDYAKACNEIRKAKKIEDILR